MSLSEAPTATSNVLVPVLRRADPFSRGLTDDQEKQLLEFAGRIGLSASKSHVRSMGHRAIAIEGRCVGRLAGDLVDLVLRGLCVRAAFERLQRPIEILEIGTLFGVNAIILHDLARSLAGSAKLTLIDPLEGYYGRGNRDVVTGLPISVENVRFNLRSNFVCDGDVELIARSSIDPATAELVGSKQFDFAFIDGDHSYAGIAADWKFYTPRVASGGFIVIDNYRDGVYPDVDRFVDEQIASTGCARFIANFARTAVFQRTA